MKTYKCKICGYNAGNFKNSLIRHIVSSARGEVWRKALGDIEKTPHFEYYKEITEPIFIKRKFNI